MAKRYNLIALGASLNHKSSFLLVRLEHDDLIVAGIWVQEAEQLVIYD